jgi:hypothetical protein
VYLYNSLANISTQLSAGCVFGICGSGSVSDSCSD